MTFDFAKGALFKMLGATASLISLYPALAADIPADKLKLAPDVVQQSAYETPATGEYVVANGTDIYSDHSFYDTKVMGNLKRGEHVQALAKVKGWDWVLVGKDGTGIGYVSISMLSSPDKYVP